MNLIKATKQTGGKRLYRKYIIDNMGDYVFDKDHTLDGNIIEFESTLEADFLESIEKYREEQKEKLVKELRKEQIPEVLDATHDQGTDEWLKARIGMITASSTPFTIKGTKIPTYDAYVDKKVAEKFLLEHGIIKESGVKNDATNLGHELEPRAIELYEKKTGNKVVSKGLVVGKDIMLGASTDGITTDSDFNKINIEIKSVFLSTYLAELTRGELVKRYYAQMQVQMYILDIDMTHFLVQSQDTDKVDLIIREVSRDEEFIYNMIETVKCFEADFKERYDKLKEHEV